MDEYYVRWRGKISGPFTREHLASLAQSGQISKHHSISTDEVQWTPAGEVEWLLKPEKNTVVTSTDSEPAVAMSARDVARLESGGQSTTSDHPSDEDHDIQTDEFDAEPEDTLNHHQLQHSGEIWWGGLGVLFLVSYLMPIFSVKGETLWNWDMLGESQTAWLGVWAFYMLAVGIALPLVGTFVAGIAQSITIFLMGFFGIFAPLFYLIIKSGQEALRSSLLSADSVLGWVIITSLILMMVGNNIRNEYQQSLLGRLLGGICAGVMIFTIIIGFLLQLSRASLLPPDSLSENFRTTLNIMLVLGTLSNIGLVVSGILVLVNIGNHGSVSGVSYAASLVASISIAMVFALLAILPLTPAFRFGINLGFGSDEKLENTLIFWSMSISLRLLGALFGLFIMMGISLANFFKITVLKGSRKTA